MLEIKRKLDDNKPFPLLLTQESNKPKNDIQDTSPINDSFGNTNTSHFLKKISSLKDDILKFKYPINHLLAYKINDINDVNRMLKPSQFIIKNNSKYLKELNIDLYEKSEKEIINYPKLKLTHPTDFEKDKFKLIDKIEMNKIVKSAVSSTLPNFSNYNNVSIEIHPLKINPPTIIKSQRFTIDGHVPKDCTFEHNSVRGKIKQSVTKLFTNNNISTTLITQQKQLNQTSEDKRVNIKNIDFSNKIQLNFNKKIKKRKGKIKVFRSTHKKTLSTNSIEIKESKNIKCNLDELGERTLILAKLINSKSKKNKIDLERISEIKYKFMMTDFKRSRFLED